MESEPLGLRLRFAGEVEDVFVDLTEDCAIRRGAHPLMPGDLTPGMSLFVPTRGPILSEIRQLVARAGPTRREVALLRGIARQIEWAAGQIAQAPVVDP